ncbi:malate dehydrogenase, mitochondrial-like [Culex quinquefasciatus]|uniref:malate dehydrogenase, mitochondrial-like n=2 Tax=Culex pipiens complex TaxID=518105 RepID=UPI0018E2F187|nr:malate dehydrogenase, mitochondrial-like [Culex quinquefasciatus]
MCQCVPPSRIRLTQRSRLPATLCPRLQFWTQSACWPFPCWSRPTRGQHSGLFRSDITKATYFSTPLLLGKNGLEKNLGLPKVNANEKELLKKAIQELKKNIQKGEELVKKK